MFLITYSGGEQVQHYMKTYTGMWQQYRTATTKVCRVGKGRTIQPFIYSRYNALTLFSITIKKVWKGRNSKNML